MARGSSFLNLSAWWRNSFPNCPSPSTQADRPCKTLAQGTMSRGAGSDISGSGRVAPAEVVCTANMAGTFDAASGPAAMALAPRLG